MWKLLGVASLVLLAASFANADPPKIGSGDFSLVLKGKTSGWRVGAPLSQGLPEGSEVLVTGLCPSCNEDTNTVATVLTDDANYNMEVGFFTKSGTFSATYLYRNKRTSMKSIPISAGMKGRAIRNFMIHIKKTTKGFEVQGFLEHPDTSKWLEMDLGEMLSGVPTQPRQVSYLSLKQGIYPLNDAHMRIYFRNIPGTEKIALA